MPLLRARGRFPLAARGFFAFELDGLYAPISVINGSDNEVTGAILDASVRVGWRVVRHVDAFVNLRYIGGGAVGQGQVLGVPGGQAGHAQQLQQLAAEVQRSGDMRAASSAANCSRAADQSSPGLPSGAPRRCQR